MTAFCVLHLYVQQSRSDITGSLSQHAKFMFRILKMSFSFQETFTTQKPVKDTGSSHQICSNLSSILYK